MIVTVTDISFWQLLGPPEESHKAVARVQLYRGPSDRKKRRVPACASAGEGLSAHINVINRQYIC